MPLQIKVNDNLVSVWSPMALPNLKWWGDASATYSLYEDAAQTIPLTVSGHSVGALVDLSAVGLVPPLTSSGTTRPIWTQNNPNCKNLGTLTGAGAQNLITTSFNNSAVLDVATNFYTICHIFRYTGLSGATYNVFSSSSDFTTEIRKENGLDALYTYPKNTSSPIISGAISDGLVHCIIVEITNGLFLSKVYLDGTLTQLVTTTNQLSSLSIMARADASFGMNGDWCEGFICSGKLISSGYQPIIRAYAQQKWGAV